MKALFGGPYRDAEGGSMSILIRGMKMPQCCAECNAEGHYETSYGDEYGFFCSFGYKAYTEETRESKRLDNCPLIPVQPHGDLIDRDALMDQIVHDTPLSAVFEKTMRRYLHNASTIIPAEEGET